MTTASGPAPANRRPPFLAIFLGCIILLFIAILVFAYVETRWANPIILDERGAPR